MDLNALLLARKLLGGVSADDTLNPQDNLGNVTSPPPLPNQPPTPSKFSALFDQSGPAVSAYKQFLSTMPNRQDYEPSTGRRIAAALAGFAGGLRNPAYGASIASDITDKPYKQAMEDYKVKGAGLQEAATLEDKEAGIKRQALRDDVIESLKQQGLAATAENIRSEMQRRADQTQNEKDKLDFERNVVHPDTVKYQQGRVKAAQDAANNATTDVSYFDSDPNSDTFGQNVTKKAKKGDVAGKTFEKPTTGSTQDKEVNANRVINQVDSLRALTPTLQKSLSPIAGNEALFEKWLGNSKDQVANKAAGMMDQLAGVHAAITGRASKQLYDEMKKSLGNINQDPEGWNGALDNAEETALNTIKAIHGDKFVNSRFGDRLKRLAPKDEKTVNPPGGRFERIQ